MSERLKAIANMVPRCQTAADIGCDHGKVAVMLIENHTARHVICSDISEKSLEKAKKTALQNGISRGISFRTGSGLQVLQQSEADAVVMAGMGGELIVRILEEETTKIPDVLVISCNSHPNAVRRWLCQNGYQIKDEDLICEGRRCYPVILAGKGESEPLSELEMELGPVILKKRPDALGKLLRTRIKTVTKIIENIGPPDSPEKQKRLNDLNRRLKDYEVILKCR